MESVFFFFFLKCEGSAAALSAVTQVYANIPEKQAIAVLFLFLVRHERKGMTDTWDI